MKLAVNRITLVGLRCLAQKCMPQQLFIECQITYFKLQFTSGKYSSFLFIFFTYVFRMVDTSSFAHNIEMHMDWFLGTLHTTYYVLCKSNRIGFGHMTHFIEWHQIKVVVTAWFPFENCNVFWTCICIQFLFRIAV